MRTLLIAVLFFFPASALAIPAISCHCFQDRSYDPQRPGAVDPYLLANARNSLFALTYDVEKKDVIRAVMSGTAPEELWATHALAAVTGRPVDQINQLRDQNRSWEDILQADKSPVPNQDDPILKAVRKGTDNSSLARLAVDRALVDRLGATTGEVEELRQHGADDRETVLAVFLGKLGKRNPGDLFGEVSRGGDWGAILAAMGLEPKGIEGAMRRLAANHPG